MCVENAVHAERTLPRGDHQLPAGGSGREVFPAGQVAVHGSGRGAGFEEQHQVNNNNNNTQNKAFDGVRTDGCLVIGNSDLCLIVTIKICTVYLEYILLLLL